MMEFKKDNDFLQGKDYAIEYITICCQFYVPETEPDTMKLFSCNWGVDGSAGLDLASCGNMTIQEAIAERLNLTSK